MGTLVQVTPFFLRPPLPRPVPEPAGPLTTRFLVFPTDRLTEMVVESVNLSVAPQVENASAATELSQDRISRMMRKMRPRAVVIGHPVVELAAEFNDERVSVVEPIPVQFFDLRPCRHPAQRRMWKLLAVVPSVGIVLGAAA